MSDYYDYDPEDFDDDGRRRPILVPDYCDCGQHVDEHDDELHDARIARLQKLASLRYGQTVTTTRNGGIMGGLTKAAKRAGLIVALFLALPLTSHAAPTAPDPSCAYSHVIPDDGSQFAVCPDGSAWVYDADGQPVPNAAGVPVRAPGWVRIA